MHTSQSDFKFRTIHYNITPQARGTTCGTAWQDQEMRKLCDLPDLSCEATMLGATCCSCCTARRAYSYTDSGHGQVIGWWGMAGRRSSIYYMKP